MWHVGTPTYNKWRERTNKKRKRRAYWLRKYKEAKGCEVCGYNLNGLALDFDHIDRSEKKFLASSRMLNLSLKSIMSEIRKCRILCANCHRIKTYDNKEFNNSTRYI